MRRRSAPDEVGEWIEEEGGLTAGVVAVDDDARVHGFASGRRRQSVFLADPASMDALADELLPWLHEQDAVVELMTFAGDVARVTACERHGFRHRRSSFTLAHADAAGPLPRDVEEWRKSVRPCRSLFLARRGSPSGGLPSVV